MKTTLKLAGLDKQYPVTLIKEKYQNGSLALEAVCRGEEDDGEPFATLSVNFPGSGSLPKNQCYFKTWTENEGFLEQLISQKIVKLVGPSMSSGFVQSPLVEVLF